MFNLRRGLFGSAAAYASAAAYVCLEVMKLCTWPCPSEEGRKAARVMKAVSVEMCIFGF